MGDYGSILITPMSQEIILSGVHITLTDAIKSAVEHKLSKLFRHAEKIIRIRVELEHAKHKNDEDAFIAKGHIEIDGPDIIVHVPSNDLYKSIDALVEKLDRKLRRRARLSRVKRKGMHAEALVA